MPETQAKKNPLEEYLKLNPKAYQDYQSIQEWFKQNTGVGTIVHDMIMWHRGLINNLLKPFRTLFEELLKKPGNLTDKKEYSEVKKKFLEITKEAFKKDDKGKEMWHDDKVANYLTWAVTFLACAEGDFEMFKQEQEKSYKLLHPNSDEIHMLVDDGYQQQHQRRCRNIGCLSETDGSDCKVG